MSPPLFIHEMPDDMESVLASHPPVAELWNKLTPLSQNEWICYVTIVKKQETRARHLVRFQEDLLAGHNRPCCWPGCPHRRQSAKKWFPHLKTNTS